MIGKRIRRETRRVRANVSALAAGVLALTRYVVDARPWLDTPEAPRALFRYALDVADLGFEPGEKVEAFGAINLQGASLEDWQMQMVATAARGTRMRDPVEHIVISWREGEAPSREQVEDAVKIVLDVMDYGRCSTVWALHGNTKTFHAHIAIVRVDPATGNAQGTGWDIDRLHQALALIEDRQGWAAEEESLFTVRDGAVYVRADGQKVRDAAGEQVGYRAPGRTLPRKIAEVAPKLGNIAGAATSWEDLHKGFLELNALYERKGSGAVIKRDSKECKASALGRECGRRELEKRLGAFRPREASLPYLAYVESCRRYLAKMRESRDAEKARLLSWLQQTLAEVAGSNPLLAHLVGAEYDAALSSLKAAFADSIETFATARLSQEHWAAAGCPALPPTPNLPAVMMPAPSAYRERRTGSPPKLIPERRGWKTTYRAKDGSRVFDDCRSFILVYQHDAASIDAALRLASRRWSSVRVSGSEQFVTKCLERASILGLDAVDDQGRRSSRGEKRSSPSARSGSRRAAPKSAPAPDPSAADPPQPDDGVDIDTQKAFLGSKGKGR